MFDVFVSAPPDAEIPRLLPDEFPRCPSLGHVGKAAGWRHSLSGPSWRPMSREPSRALRSPGWPVVLWIKDDFVYELFLYVFNFLF